MPEDEGGLPDEVSSEAVAFDEERQALARRYEREALALGLGSTALLLAILVLVLVTGVSVRLEGWAQQVSGRPWIVVALYVTLGYGALQALALPLRAAGRASDLRYGLARGGWGAWALDRAKAFLFGWLLALAAAELLYWTLREFGPLWWVAFWLLALAFTLLTSFVGPVLLLPLFYRVRRVEDADLRERVHRLALRAGIRVLDVYEFASSAKTERGTAALAGLGRTRRVLLSDHILERYTPREVEGILAHEIAHHLRRDAPRTLLLSAAVSLLALALAGPFVRATMPAVGIESLQQVANLPLFLLFGALFYTAVGPLQRALSRRREARADRVGARLCGDPRALASALVKLHGQGLTNATPPRAVEILFYTHPAGERRVRALLALAGPSA